MRKSYKNKTKKENIKNKSYYAIQSTTTISALNIISYMQRSHITNFETKKLSIQTQLS